MEGAEKAAEGLSAIPLPSGQCHSDPEEALDTLLVSVSQADVPQW